MEKVVKILCVFTLCIIMLFIPQNSYCTEIGLQIKKEVQVADAGKGIFELGDLDKYKGTPDTSTKLKKKLNIVFSVIQTVGIIISVIILLVLGIKYMTGSIEEKANYKKTMIPYVIRSIFSIYWKPITTNHI